MSDTPNARPGAAASTEDGSDALPIGTRLAEFEIRQVLGAGGFGIVYSAWDEALQREVALKEYMPTSLAGRGAGGSVTLRSRMQEENFSLGLQSFVNEARLLARFDQPALVKVFRFWEGNGTAYMAMPLYKGRNLRQLRKGMAPGTLDDAWMRALIEPLLGALEVMHEATVYHRDIAPDNIIWCDDNRPVLLDFGAARLVLADRTQNVTAILKPQFAPIEQYAETQTMRQGPWTDLYALAGTCYFMLTGRAPLPATARVMGDELEPLARLAPAGCSPRLLQILDWAMAVRPQDRPQSVAQFRAALAGEIPVPVRPWPAAHGTAPAEPPPDTGGYDKTIQATMRTTPTHQASPPASAPTPRHRHDHDELERPERSVMLPPKSGLPLRPLLLLLILAAAGAGAWQTREQWMPMVGLQVAALAPADSASAPEPAASDAAAMPVAASAPIADAASATSAIANDVAASAAATPASEAASAAPLTVVEAPAPAPVPPPTRPKPNKEARARALEAKLAALKLPPPVLPPTNEAHVVAQEHPALIPQTEAVEPTSTAAASASTAGHGLGPREACAGLDPAKMAVCVRRLCDSEPRYARYPICQRVHRAEEQQQ